MNEDQIGGDGTDVQGESVDSVGSFADPEPALEQMEEEGADCECAEKMQRRLCVCASAMRNAVRAAADSRAVIDKEKRCDAQQSDQQPQQMFFSVQLKAIHHNTGLTSCRKLLSVEILQSVTRPEVGADIPVSRDNHEFIGLFYIIDIVAVLGFRLVESVRIVHDSRGAALIFFLSFVTEFISVLFKMLFAQIPVPECEDLFPIFTSVITA